MALKAKPKYTTSPSTHQVHMPEPGSDFRGSSTSLRSNSQSRTRVRITVSTSSLGLSRPESSKSPGGR
eukprot:9960239-Alexandrium_andersonii.AAC.1